MLGTRNESTVNVEFIVQGFVIRCAYTCQKPTFRARLLGMLSPSIGRIDSSPYETCASIYRFLNYKMYDARRIRYAANRNRTRINLCMLRSRYVKASSFFVNVAHVPILLLFPQRSRSQSFKTLLSTGWKPFIALIFSYVYATRKMLSPFTSTIRLINRFLFAHLASQSRNAFWFAFYYMILMRRCSIISNEWIHFTMIVIELAFFYKTCVTMHRKLWKTPIEKVIIVRWLAHQRRRNSHMIIRETEKIALSSRLVDTGKEGRL